MDIISDPTNIGTYSELTADDVVYRVGFSATDSGVTVIVAMVFVCDKLVKSGAASYAGDRVYTKK